MAATESIGDRGRPRRRLRGRVLDWRLDVLGILLLVLPAVASCNASGGGREPPATFARLEREFPGLDNVFVVAEGLYSGSMPQGDAGFESLTALGVRTIVSVDAAQPNLEVAQARGMRYVHIPIGYDGVDGSQRLLLARTVRDLKRPIYIHCHHGRHRGPTAAVLALVLLGRCDGERGIEMIRAIGTSDRYPGLFRVIETAVRLPEETISLVPDGDLVAHAEVRGLAAVMAEVDRVVDHLVSIHRAGWSIPEEHPDLAPVAEAGRLTDLLRGLVDDPDVAASEREFRERLKQAIELAGRLETAVVSGDPAAASGHFTDLRTRCTDCHERYRDRGRER